MSDTPLWWARFKLLFRAKWELELVIPGSPERGLLDTFMTRRGAMRAMARMSPGALPGSYYCVQKARWAA